MQLVLDQTDKVGKDGIPVSFGDAMLLCLGPHLCNNLFILVGWEQVGHLKDGGREGGGRAVAMEIHTYCSAGLSIYVCTYMYMYVHVYLKNTALCMHTVCTLFSYGTVHEHLVHA